PKTVGTHRYSAGAVVTALRTDPQEGARGISLCGIEATDPGVSRGHKLDKAGQDESDTAELCFDNVRLGDDRVIGELGRGFIYMMGRLPQGRLSAAGCNLARATQFLVDSTQCAGTS